MSKNANNLSIFSMKVNNWIYGKIIEQNTGLESNTNQCISTETFAFLKWHISHLPVECKWERVQVRERERGENRKWLRMSYRLAEVLAKPEVFSVTWNDKKSEHWIVYKQSRESHMALDILSSKEGDMAADWKGELENLALGRWAWGGCHTFLSQHLTLVCRICIT
jgi:hypothetical protein